MIAALLIVHAAATAMMTGLVWFVQVVHYPLLHAVGADGFASYEAAHVRRTGRVVAPLMLVEAGAAALLPFVLPGAAAPLAWTGLALLAVVWLSTALLQVPAHRHLERGYDRRTVDRLVATNWVRTIAWSGRTVAALLLLSRFGSVP